MNLIHLKYAVVIAETGSMTKAAQKLYTAQPNLSRAIHELENSLGITLFKRTSQGLYPTPDGEEFLQYARNVLRQVDAIEEIYRSGRKKQIKFSISVPRASYIACAFTEFIKDMNTDIGAEIIYKETNALRAINNITNSDYKLGIIRYRDIYEDKFTEMLKEKNIKGELLSEFKCSLLISKRHPLASKGKINPEDLKHCTEIAHSDVFVPSIPLSTVRKSEAAADTDRHIYVFERGSQMDILAESENAFMWTSPIPEKLLARYGLVMRECQWNDRLYKDVLIYKAGYTLTETDKKFLDKLAEVKTQLDMC